MNKLHNKYRTSEELAARLRLHVLQMITPVRGSHIGSALSAADILAVLYYSFLHYDPDNGSDTNRDRLIFSKGHAGSCLYAVLAEAGFFPVEMLQNYCRNGSPLSGHVNSHRLPGVEFSTGSLGHGLPVGAGISYSLKMRRNPAKTVVIVGDGECEEGTTWESAIFAAAKKLDNLIVIVDRNRIQALGNTEDIMPLEPFEEKWKSFGWQTSVIDGHDHRQILDALQKPAASAPHCIIARSIKGKGVSFMEDQLLWHYRTPDENQFKQAFEELSENLK